MGIDPISMALIGGGTLLSAGGQISGGISANRAAGINARIQDNQADQIESQTRADVASHRRGFDKFRGRLRADLAAYGASSSSGTGLLLAQEAARQAKLDELNMITEGTNKANAVRMGADMTRYEGRVAKRQAILGGLGTAMKGFGDLSAMAG